MSAAKKSTKDPSRVLAGYKGKVTRFYNVATDALESGISDVNTLKKMHDNLDTAFNEYSAVMNEYMSCFTVDKQKDLQFNYVDEVLDVENLLDRLLISSNPDDQFHQGFAVGVNNFV